MSPELPSLRNGSAKLCGENPADAARRAQLLQSSARSFICESRHASECSLIKKTPPPTNIRFHMNAVSPSRDFGSSPGRRSKATPSLKGEGWLSLKLLRRANLWELAGERGRAEFFFSESSNLRNGRFMAVRCPLARRPRSAWAPRPRCVWLQTCALEAQNESRAARMGSWGLA